MKVAFKPNPVCFWMRNIRLRLIVDMHEQSSYIVFLRGYVQCRRLQQVIGETHLEDFHEASDVEFGIQRDVMDLGDEIRDNLLKVSELLFKIVNDRLVLHVVI